MSVASERPLAQPNQAAIDNAEKVFAADAAANRRGSLTAGVVSGPGLVWTKSYGFADEEARTPAARDTVYRIGSITKQFTAVMLLQLAEHGKVSLSDPVDKYFPAVRQLKGWPPPQPITLLQLATHRAGLAREPDGCVLPFMPCRHWIGPDARWEQTLTSALPHVRLKSAPDAGYAYSNVGYAILGAALNRAVGEPYTGYVAQNIFAPLQMHHTEFEPNAEMRAKLARGYVVLLGVANSSMPEAELRMGRGYKVPSGAIFATVDDLSKFVAFEMGEGPESVLPRDVLRANFERAFPTSDRADGRSVGVGFGKQQVQGHVIIGKNGSVTGYTAAAYFNPDSKIGVVCLRSSSVPCDNTAQRALLALLGGQRNGPAAA